MTLGSKVVHQFRREAEAAYQRAEEALILSKEHNFTYYLGWAMIIRGWSLSVQGDGKEGAIDIHQGLEMLLNTGAKRSVPYYLSLLAEVYGINGQAEEALQTISEAFKEAQNIGEHWWEAELFRLKGELLLKQSNSNANQAEKSLHTAIDVARRQNSISLELRATISLCRLKQQLEINNHAHQLLVDVYNRFTEGFDTPDLKEAKDLINELA